MIIEKDNFTEAYNCLCKKLVDNGEYVNPRNSNTKEILGVCIKINNPRTRIISSKERNLSLPFAIGEWSWCMQGRNDLEMIQYYAPSYYRFSDDMYKLHGAYGPRIKENIPKIINLLKKDCNSRRAVISIYRESDIDFDSKDIPCTISFQFFIRNKKLDMIVNMRSNDVFLGFPYDIFNFTMIQEYIAVKLNVEIGIYTHMVGSMHYYLKDEKKLLKIIEENAKQETEMEKMKFYDVDKALQDFFLCEERIRMRNYKNELYSKDNYFYPFLHELEGYNIKKLNKHKALYSEQTESPNVRKY